MANAFFVRCDCRNRRFTGGKSRFLQEADGRKGIASAADELCGIAFIRGGPKGWRGRSESCQTGSVHRLVSGGHETVTCGGYAATPRLLLQKEGDHPRQRRWTISSFTNTSLLQHASSSFTRCCISSMFWSALSKENFRGEVVLFFWLGYTGHEPR